MNKLGILIAALAVVISLWYVDVVPGLWDIQHAGEDIETINAERRSVHRQARLTTFEHDKVPPGAVLFFGSSTIERMPLHFLFKDAPAVNRGIGEEESERLHARLASATSPAVWPTVTGVVLYAGSLDRIRLDASPEVIAERVRAIVDDALQLAPDAEVLVLGLLPQRDTTASESEELALTNQGLASIATTRDRVSFLNLDRAPLRDPLGKLSTAHSNDRFHLNADGYQVLADWIRREGGGLAPLLFPDSSK